MGLEDDMTRPVRTYAGIGSRNTPEPVLAQMRNVALVLAQEGFWLRSGGARGADQAFETGAKALGRGARFTIYRPGGFSFNEPKSRRVRRYAPDWMDWAEGVAASAHPAWHRCSRVAQRLHTRNVAQILGHDMTIIPVDFVLCWTPDGAEREWQTSRSTGGTGQAIRIASKCQIPVLNLANENWVTRLAAIVK